MGKTKVNKDKVFLVFCVCFLLFVGFSLWGVLGLVPNPRVVSLGIPVAKVTERPELDVTVDGDDDCSVQVVDTKHGERRKDVASGGKWGYDMFMNMGIMRY
jgi:hypothetical protein